MNHSFHNRNVGCGKGFEFLDDFVVLRGCGPDICQFRLRFFLRGDGGTLDALDEFLLILGATLLFLCFEAILSQLCSLLKTVLVDINCKQLLVSQFGGLVLGCLGIIDLLLGLLDCFVDPTRALSH